MTMAQTVVAHCSCPTYLVFVLNRKPATMGASQVGLAKRVWMLLPIVGLVTMERVPAELSMTLSSALLTLHSICISK